MSFDNLISGNDLKVETGAGLPLTCQSVHVMSLPDCPSLPLHTKHKYMHINIVFIHLENFSHFYCAVFFYHYQIKSLHNMHFTFFNTLLSHLQTRIQRNLPRNKETNQKETGNKLLVWIILFQRSASQQHQRHLSQWQQRTRNIKQQKAALADHSRATHVFKARSHLDVMSQAWRR